MQVYSKERPGRWVVFERKADGTTARLYSTNRPPAGMRRVPWPIAYADESGSIASMIKVVTNAPQA
jgi:hypothetical protein